MPQDAGAHAPLFVLMSLVVAVLGSWTALGLFRRVEPTFGHASRVWLGVTAIAVGASIWAMHFTAMLGWDPGGEAVYEPRLIVASLVVPMLAVAAGLIVLVASKRRWLGLALTAVIIGAAIVGMHMIGMAAVRGPFRLGYDPGLLAVASAVAVGASAGGLWAARRDTTLSWRALAAFGLGFAIVGMHYIGMAAVEVTPAPGHAVAAGLDRHGLAMAVGACVSLLVIAAVASTAFARGQGDMAEREELALRRSEQQLAAILEQMPFGVLVAEAPSGAIRYGNAEAARLMGHPVIRAESPEDYGRYGSLHADGRPMRGEEHAMARAVMKGERIDREHQIYRRGDGELITLEVSAAPIRDEGGEVVLAVATFQDVTGTLQAQQALGRAQRMEAVGQLTGGVAHDFNNLLTAVMGSVSMALKRVDDEGVRRLLGNALQGAQRGAKLTAQLLAFSRRQRLETRAVDVNAMIEGMRDLLSSTLGGGVRVEFDLSADLPAAKADPTQLELAVLNLAINARDAMPGGGVLTISTSTFRVDRQNDPHEPEPGDYAVVCVCDTGTGMPAEVLGKVFEPFFTTKPVGKGSGLGLSQVLGLAKQMGGGVRVETSSGHGTKVSIYLPEAETELAPVAAEVADAPVSVAGARVLVVDDDADVRRYVHAVLEEAGCEVEAVDCGAEAVARVQAGLRPDVVLVDFAMPGLNGLETARRIAGLQPDTPVLIMTGYADLEALPPGLDRGRLVQKPFEAEELFKRIGGLLRREQAASSWDPVI